MAETLFHITSTQRTPLGERHNADGTVDIYAYATAGASVGTLYQIVFDQYGYVAAALADGSERAKIGTPQQAIASATSGWFTVGGYVSGVTTASLDLDPKDLVKIHDGATADSGTTYTASVFAITPDDDDGSAATTHNLILMNHWIVKTT